MRGLFLRPRTGQIQYPAHISCNCNELTPRSRFLPRETHKHAGLYANMIHRPSFRNWMFFGAERPRCFAEGNRAPSVN